jgi:hypothetical protein
MRELWYVNSVPDRSDCFGIHWTAPEEGLPPLTQAPDRLEGQVKLPPNWALKPLPVSPRDRKCALTKERDFWEEVTDLSWGTQYRPRDTEQAFWRSVERTGVEHHWRRWQRPVLCPGFLKMAARFGILGPKSKLERKRLYRVLKRPVRRIKKVWVPVGEDVPIVEEAWPDLGPCCVDFSFRPTDDLTERKFPVRRWVRFEASADRFIQ